jgi:PadR family transcriptional regulator PadR
MILLSRAEEIILLAVSKLEDQAYGVTIREQIFKDIGHHWSFGVIYKTLKKMKSKNYVKKIASEPLSERGGRSRYYYQITPEGVAELEKIRSVHSSIWKGILNFSFDDKSK